MKQVLSDFVSLIFGEPENSGAHSWGAIIGVLVFLILTVLLLALGGI